MRRRAVGTNVAGSGLSTNGISLQACATRDVPNVQRLVGKHIGGVHQFWWKREAAFVSNIGTGDGEPMNLCTEQLSYRHISYRHISYRHISHRPSRTSNGRPISSTSGNRLTEYSLQTLVRFRRAER